jgi:hypothetical protein
MSCIQKLISHKAVPEDSVDAILKIMHDLINSSLEMQLKILQTILPLQTAYSSISGDVVAELLFICFKLQESKSPIVSNTAAATVRQLVIHIFEKLIPEQLNSQDENTRKLQAMYQKDSCLIFLDLCALASNDQISFLKVPNNVPRSLYIELIESILANNFQTIKNEESLFNILKKKLCPIVIKSFSEKPDFPVTVRLFRIIQILIKNFHDVLVPECDILFTIFAKFIELDSVALWIKILTVECYKDIVSDITLTK